MGGRNRWQNNHASHGNRCALLLNKQNNNHSLLDPLEYRLVHSQTYLKVSQVQIQSAVVSLVRVENVILLANTNALMDADQPKTRRESKKFTKDKKDTCYSSKHIRQVEAAKEKNKSKNK